MSVLDEVSGGSLSASLSTVNIHRLNAGPLELWRWPSGTSLMHWGSFVFRRPPPLLTRWPSVCARPDLSEGLLVWRSCFPQSPPFSPAHLCVCVVCRLFCGTFPLSPSHRITWCCISQQQLLLSLTVDTMPRSKQKT